ncbi:conserved hypothetical protein [Ricinus communis]|uniref:Uncharacterized protein n=1 Tax=Ricinus communis TaxID=3988 RepID=B9RHQ6_RICCO|nr:conserved hypothetical protein [Ricinus communis]
MGISTSPNRILVRDVKSRGVMVISSKGSMKAWVVSDHLFSNTISAVASFLSLNLGRMPKNKWKMVASTRSLTRDGMHTYYSDKPVMLPVNVEQCVLLPRSSGLPNIAKFYPTDMHIFTSYLIFK